jgi:hypothetical protein
MRMMIMRMMIMRIIVLVMELLDPAARLGGGVKGAQQDAAAGGSIANTNETK